jgi:hypothetical protein
MIRKRSDKILGREKTEPNTREDIAHAHGEELIRHLRTETAPGPIHEHDICRLGLKAKEIGFQLSIRQ